MCEGTLWFKSIGHNYYNEGEGPTTRFAYRPSYIECIYISRVSKNQDSSVPNRVVGRTSQEKNGIGKGRRRDGGRRRNKSYGGCHFVVEVHVGPMWVRGRGVPSARVWVRLLVCVSVCECVCVCSSFETRIFCTRPV